MASGGEKQEWWEAFGGVDEDGVRVTRGDDELPPSAASPEAGGGAGLSDEEVRRREQTSSGRSDFTRAKVVWRSLRAPGMLALSQGDLVDLEGRLASCWSEKRSSLVLTPAVTLPDRLSALVPHLKQLSCASAPLESLNDDLPRCTSLSEVDFGLCRLVSLPESFPEFQFCASIGLDSNALNDEAVELVAQLIRRSRVVEKLYMSDQRDWTEDKARVLARSLRSAWKLVDVGGDQHIFAGDGFDPALRQLAAAELKRARGGGDPPEPYTPLVKPARRSD